MTALQYRTTVTGYRYVPGNGVPRDRPLRHGGSDELSQSEDSQKEMQNRTESLRDRPSRLIRAGRRIAGYLGKGGQSAKTGPSAAAMAAARSAAAGSSFRGS